MRGSPETNKRQNSVIKVISVRPVAKERCVRVANACLGTFRVSSPSKTFRSIVKPSAAQRCTGFLQNGFTLVSVKFPIHPVTRIFFQLADNFHEQMDSRAFCGKFLKCEIARNVQTWRFLYFSLETLLFQLREYEFRGKVDLPETRQLWDSGWVFFNFETEVKKMSTLLLNKKI